MPTPDIDGKFGSAWKYDGHKPPNLKPEDDRVVGQYMVWCPLISERRAHWLIAVMDMSASGYAPGILKKNPLSTHELGIVEIADDLDMNPHVPGGITLVPTPPLKFEFAVSGATAAARFLDAVTRGVVGGTVFPEPGPIAGVGPYHAETLAALLEESDPAWYLTRGLRPSPVLAQVEWKNKTWTISRSPLGTSRISRN